MSYYDDDRPPRRQPATRERDRDPRRDNYDDDTYAPSRNGRSDRRDVRETSLVRRRDDSADSIEEVTRDFPPGDRGGYLKETTIRKRGTRPVKSRSFENDRYDERSSYISSRRGDSHGTAKSRSSRAYDDRRSDDRDYDRRDDRRGDARRDKPDARGVDRRDDRSDRRSRRQNNYSDESSQSPPPRRRKEERRKSMGEEALAALGLGGIAGTLLGKKDDDRSRSRNRGSGRDGRRARSYSDGRRSRSRGGGRNQKVGKDQIAQAIKAAVLAGAGEAFRVKDLPGGWGGEKGKRILTAAISAGGVDGLISNNRNPKEHGTVDVIGSAIAGLAANRLVNGSARSASQGPEGPDGRGRSTSRGRGGGGAGGGFGDLAAGGVLAAAGKKAYDTWRSRSRGRQRSESESSYDSRDGPGQRRRSKSVSGYAAKAAAAVGLHDVAEKMDPSRRSQRDEAEYDDYRPGRNGPQAGAGYNGYQNDRDVGSQPRSGPNESGETVVSPNTRDHGIGADGYSLDYGPHHNGDPETDSDSSLGSSSGEEKEAKKAARKQWITAGLATVATIHAAHNVYASVEQRKERQKELKKGEITKEEAKKMKKKAQLQDAASVGIAALGIKGAYSEWKEMKETREEIREGQEKMERHAEKRHARREKVEKMRSLGMNHSTSTPNLRRSGEFQGWDGFNNGQMGPGGNQYAQAPPMRYYDDNPYGAGHPPYSAQSATDRYNPQGNVFPPPPPGPVPGQAYPNLPPPHGP